MLNILSFFLINNSTSFTFTFSDCFDAQYFELFLNTQNLKNVNLNFTFVSMLNILSFFLIRCLVYYRDKEKNVSMLNILSFFLIAHSTTTVNKYPLRYLSEKNYSCDIFSHFYHHLEIKKAVANCSEKILKLKIISPLSVYKNYKKKQRYLQKNLTLTSDFLRSK